MLSSIMSCESCNGCNSTLDVQRKPINIVVILDTSDRIDERKHPDQITIDKELVNGIIDSYHRYAREEMFLIPDRLTFIVPEQPATDAIPLNVTKRLKIWPTRTATTEGANAFKKLENEARSAVEDVYAFVKNQNRYTGSDIWNWFRLQCDGCLNHDMRNIIICLSDGYLDFDRSIQEKRPKLNNKTSYMRFDLIKRLADDPGWKSVFNDEGHGLLEFEQDFSDYDVKFMMVEMKLRDFNLLYEREIIETYWEKWLSSMGITKSKFVYSGANAIDAVEDYLLQDDKQLTKTH